MQITVPNSIKAIAPQVKGFMDINYPHVLTIEDIAEVAPELLGRWYRVCNEHELFHTDLNRYVEDICFDKAYNTPAF